MKTAILIALTLSIVAFLILSQPDTGATLANSQCVIVDDFEDGTLAYWTPLGGCGTLEETGGQMLLTKSEECVGGITAKMDTSLIKLIGDFDVQVEFDLINFPPASTSGARFHGMAIRNASTGQNIAVAERFRVAGSSCSEIVADDNYKFFTTNGVCPAPVYIPGSDDTGMLRIVRTAANVRGFYWSGSHWIQAISATAVTDDARLDFYSATGNPSSLTTGHTAAFDNLSVCAPRQVNVTDLTLGAPYVDWFDDGVLSPFWVDASGRGNVSKSGGALVHQKLSGGTGTSVANLDPKYMISGDFDIRVDFEFVDFDFPSTGYRWQSIKLFKTDESGLLGGMERWRSESTGGCGQIVDAYKLYSNSTEPCSSIYTAATATQGTFRLTRDGTAFSAYYENAGGWELGLSTTVPLDDIYIRFSSGSGDGDSGAHEVKFDNLVILPYAAAPTAIEPGTPPKVQLDLSVFPNPSQGAFDVAMTLPERSTANVQIYDVKGRLVASILDRSTAFGSIQARFNGLDLQGRSVASGIYFVRAAAGNLQTTQKIVIIK